MVVVGIIFLILFSFFSICIVGAICNVQKELERLNNRNDEIIRVLKK